MRKKQAYAIAKEMAMNNGQEFHLAAILWRKGKLIRIGINSTKTDPSFQRYYSNGHSTCAHAEMDALQVAKSGDYLEVMRWNPYGEVMNAKPCGFCQLRIKRFGVNTRFTNKEGKWTSL